MVSAIGYSAIQSVITAIVGGVFTLPFAEFRQLTLAEIRSILPFDTAAWGSGVYSANQILSISSLGLAESSLITYAEKWQEHDFVRSAAANSPGQAFRNEDVMPLDTYHKTAIYLEYSHPAGIEHALGIVEHDPVTDLAEMIFLFRENKEAPFTDQECECLEKLSPHLMLAWRHAQIVHHYRSLAEGNGSQFSSPESYAIADYNGLLHASGEAFSLALRSIDPQWTGPFAPKQLASLIDGSISTTIFKDFEFSARKSQAHILLWVTPRDHSLGLSSAEMKAAHLYASGLTKRDIANKLGISASTVRNQLSSVFDKLGIHSKLELVRALTLKHRQE